MGAATKDSAESPLLLVRADKGRARNFSLDGNKVTKSLQHETMPIIAACRHGDIERLATLLSARPPPTVAELSRCDAAGMTAMAWASKSGRCEIVSALLAAKASPNLVPPTAAAEESEAESASEAHPPLYLALTKGRFDVAQQLLEAGACASDPEPVRRQTPLHAACSSADAPLDLVASLLRALRRDAKLRDGDAKLDDIDDIDDINADDDIDADDAPPQVDGSPGGEGNDGDDDENDHVDAKSAEAARTAPPLPADSEGCTPLHSACASGKADCARLLLRCSHSALEVRRESFKRVTPLGAACRRRHADVASLLVVDFGAPLDPMSVHLCLSKTDGADLLRRLVHESHIAEEARKAAGQGVNATAQGAAQGAAEGAAERVAGQSKGDTYLNSVSLCGGGVDARFEDTGVSALMLASESGDEEAVRTLLELGADAGAADSDGHTPLMRAAFMGHAKIVGLLVKAGCAVDATDAEGNSALHHAGRGSQEFIFDLLEMRHGADSELKNAKGEVPKVSAEPCKVQ